MPVQFPDRAQAWVVGCVPTWGPVRGNQLMFLYLFFFISLHENKLKNLLKNAAMSMHISFPGTIFDFFEVELLGQ